MLLDILEFLNIKIIAALGSNFGDDIDGNTLTNDEIGFSVAISNDGKVFTGGKNSKGLINNASNGYGIVKAYEFRDPNVTFFAYFSP